MDRFTTELRGYSKEEVNKLLEQVISEIEINLGRIKHQEMEIDSLRKKLIEYHDVEDRLNHALEQAEESKINIKRIAEKEADMIVAEARHNASRIVNDALIKAERLELKRDTLERNMRIYKRKLKSIVEQQLEIVEEIEVLEL